MLKKILLALILIFAAFFPAGCQTVQGIGKDITSIGQAGERALERAGLNARQL